MDLHEEKNLFGFSPEVLAQLSKTFYEIPFNRTLGLRFDHLETNQVKITFDMKPELVGNFLHGILHGGVISSVLDMVGGVVVMLAAIQKQTDKSLEALANTLGKSSTINLNINYLRPGKGNHFIAKGFLMHAGNKISTARMELHNQDSVLIATGTGNYLTG